MKKAIYKNLFCFLLLALTIAGHAQEPVIRSPRLGRPTNTPQLPSSNNTIPKAGTAQRDSTNSKVERRDYSDDSLNVRLYFLGSTRPSKFDTSIRDYTIRFPIPATHIYLGNDGSATRSLLFSTPMRAGWDPGFHAFDVYKLKLENVRFFSTPKPLTELGYTLATGTEQIIEILHTQNIKPYWNVSFNYRLINAPGIFRNQKTNHNNYLLTSWYQSPAKRYNNYFVFLSNSIQAGESGGIKSDNDYLNDPIYERNRFIIPSNIGGNPSFGADPFSSSINTGRREKETTFFLRQQYDLGRKDSLVTDSTVIPLFYPRVRFEYNLRFTKYDYIFQDLASSSGRLDNTPDSAYYDSSYAIKFRTGDSVLLQDKWREISNDFSIYQFPDANNLQQYIKVGAELQLLKGTFKTGDKSFYNVIGHGEYRNRTKNQKWDINAFARLHLAGMNIGDYHAYISLQRLLSEKLGTLQIGFENINRSPSFNYNQRSSFYLDAPKDFSKENTAHFFASYFEPKLGLQLKGDYFLVGNYLYLKNYKSLEQERALFNVLRLSALKSFRLSRSFYLHSEVYVQQKAGGAEVNLPVFYTRNRIAYEGRLFKNLNLSSGLELRYYTPYKADNYSPVLGQFFYQDSVTIANRPDVHLFVHLRIRTFKAYVRFENLNTITTAGGFRFNKNNLAAPSYPLPGLVFRFGIYWTFIN